MIPEEINKANKRRKQIKMNKTTSVFYKVNKIGKPLASLRKKKNQINKVRNEKGDFTTNVTQIKRIIRHCYEQ